MKELTTIELGQVSGAGSVMKKGDLLKEAIEYAHSVIGDMPSPDFEWPIIPIIPYFPPYLEPVCGN
ncbi:hypothetical protein [Xenorhabdus sp. SGI246]|uniref:hypothetical protein n=1 Tax=Xenorhabdus sp. SGI246 TaxID=3158263 RepID=UPI00349F7D60